MQKRQLGKNGPDLTVIGFGAWAIGGPWIYGWGKVDDEESIRAIHRGLDLGINWIDTAAAYGFGHSEEVVERAVRRLAQKPFIATKCGLVSDGKGGTKNSLRPESIRKEAEDSLRRLKVECIDLYQIHWADRDVVIEDSWGTLADLQREGKLRYIGVSNFGVGLLKRCMAIAPVQSLQPPYSLLVRDVEKDVLDYCQKNEIGVVAYSPMQAGLLSGRFDVRRLAPDDWRQKNPLFREPELSKGLRFVDALRPIAEKHGKTVGQLAVAWVLRRAEVTSAIVGARAVGQVEENVGAAGWVLTDEEVSQVESIYQAHYS